MGGAWGECLPVHQASPVAPVMTSMPYLPSTSLSMRNHCEKKQHGRQDGCSCGVCNARGGGTLRWTWTGPAPACRSPAPTSAQCSRPSPERTSTCRPGTGRSTWRASAGSSVGGRRMGGCRSACATPALSERLSWNRGRPHLADALAEVVLHNAVDARVHVDPKLVARAVRNSGERPGRLPWGRSAPCRQCAVGDEPSGRRSAAGKRGRWPSKRTSWRCSWSSRGSRQGDRQRGTRMSARPGKASVAAEVPPRRVILEPNIRGCAWSDGRPR